MEHNELETKRERRLRILRQWLNCIFMIIAIVGVVWWFVGDQDVATCIIIASMPFKFSEACIRAFKIK